MIQAIINNIPVEVEQGTTILEAAEKIGVKIPALCRHEDLPPTAACGICIVKIKNMRGKMTRACSTPIENGMEITTHDNDIIRARKTIIELILSDHPNDCLQCGRNNRCELQKISAEFGIREIPFDPIKRESTRDDSTKAIVLNPQKCIRCGRCIEICQKTQNVWALTFLERGIKTRFAASGDITLEESPCVKCGQCAAHCPVGAIFEYNEANIVWNALNDQSKFPVVQIAPAVRTALGEEFGFEPGENITLKIYSALKRLGFKAIFDTSFGADVTIMEEASEFVERFVRKKGKLPLITTCCPSWVDFMEKKHTDMIEHFSTCKSPHEISGVLSKTYFAALNNIDPAKIFMVSIMPCTSKKFEISRSEEMSASGFKDVDVVLTTREFARILKQAGIMLKNIPNELPDHLLGNYSGAGVIFGATGGVMEAALRTANYLIENKNMENPECKGVRGSDGIKESKYMIAGQEVRVAVAHGLGNVETVLDRIREAEKNKTEPPYHFVEVMACEGGCVAGGGQPYGINNTIRAIRSKGLYENDLNKKEQRCSHDNPYIKKLYTEFLEKPLSHQSHKLLHTKYMARKEYQR